MAKKNVVRMPKWVKILVWAGAVIILAAFLLLVWISKVINSAPKSINNDPPVRVVRLGNPLDSTSRSVFFSGCGSAIPGYRYSIDLPSNWDITMRDYSQSSVYFDAFGDGNTFTVSCTTLGVGGDVCDDKYRTKFEVNGKQFEPCFGLVNGKWNMGVLNLETDSKTNATVSFWSIGLDKAAIDKILSSFKLLGQ